MTDNSRKGEMLLLREQGFSNAEIARQIRVNRSHVYNVIGAPPVTAKQLRIQTAPALLTEGTDAARALPSLLTAWRLKHSLSQSDAIKILDLAHVSTLSSWERGKGCSLPGLVIKFINLWEFKQSLLTVDS